MRTPTPYHPPRSVPSRSLPEITKRTQSTRPNGVAPGSKRGQKGEQMGSKWGAFGVALGSVWGRFFHPSKSSTQSSTTTYAPPTPAITISLPTFQLGTGNSRPLRNKPIRPPAAPTPNYPPCPKSNETGQNRTLFQAVFFASPFVSSS